jgi:phosphoribosyl-ATP pyrophosphohydrolase
MTTFQELFDSVNQRALDRPENSRTVELLDLGVHAIGKKVVEEAAEVWMAAEHEGKERTAEEISQLIYHLVVMMQKLGISVEDIEKEL